MIELIDVEGRKLNSHCTGSERGVHLFSDWLTLHGFDRSALNDLVANLRARELIAAPFDVARASSSDSDTPTPDLAAPSACRDFVRNAFATVFANLGRQTDFSERIAFVDLPHGDDTPPHTIDRGPDADVLIAMRWSGEPADLICMAHEFGHAAQILSSGHQPTPPAARELCAFLGELLVIDHARSASQDLWLELTRVWREENGIYLGADLERLAAALADPRATYHYRLNYPLARLSAVDLFECARDDLGDVFAAGSNALTSYLHDVSSAGAAKAPNPLPPLPEPSSDLHADFVYRSLGAMMMIDLEYVSGPAEPSIEDCYSIHLNHLQTQTARVVLNESRQPVGYGAWRGATGEESSVLTRLAAPFGDYGVIARSVEQRMAEGSTRAAQSDSFGARTPVRL